MDNAIHAMIMAFSAMVFVFGLSLAMYMFTQVTSTSETMFYLSDKTNFYENIDLKLTENATEKRKRIVDVETIIPTLYRYYKERFCVKVLDSDGNLMQIFDINTEGAVRKAASTAEYARNRYQRALFGFYNDNTKPYYLYEAPWIGDTDQFVKTRIDFYINGDDGYINNTYVDYRNSYFSRVRAYNRARAAANDNDNIIYFEENFVSYSYKGETYTNDEGDILITGVQPEDKIVVIYKATKKLP